MILKILFLESSWQMDVHIFWPSTVAVGMATAMSELVGVSRCPSRLVVALATYLLSFVNAVDSGWSFETAREMGWRWKPSSCFRRFDYACISIEHSSYFPTLGTSVISLFLYTCMQKPRLRTVYRQRKWPLLAPVRKIMALGRKKMALGCKIIALGWNVF